MTTHAALAEALKPHGNWDYARRGTDSPWQIACDCGWSAPMPGGPVAEDIRVWREHVATAILAALPATDAEAAVLAAAEAWRDADLIDYADAQHIDALAAAIDAMRADREARQG